jgi:fructose/tagatose bisphosphate aldolase
MNIAQTQASCAKARALMTRARSEGFAVGAFNIDNQ